MKVDNAENVKHSIETVHMDMMMSIAAHPWHRYTHRQTVRNNSTILLVFKGIFFGCNSTRMKLVIEKIY